MEKTTLVILLQRINTPNHHALLEAYSRFHVSAAIAA